MTNTGTKDIIRGLRNPSIALRYLRDQAYRRSLSARFVALSRLQFGTNILDLDWELAIVLDSCRVDALREVAATGDYDFLTPDDIPSMTSVGGATFEWTAATFTNVHAAEIERTAFISANGWPYKVLRDGFRPEQRFGSSSNLTKWDTVSEDTLGRHVLAWRFGDGRAGWSEQPQAGAKTVVDLAIQIGRRNEYDRVIAHLIEPHYPYAAAARARNADELNEVEQDPINYLRHGGDRDAVWKNYLTELRYGLNSVSTLLDNFDASNVLITADHGECFGEWEMYGHNPGVLAPKVRKVPKVFTTASDSGTHQPDVLEEDTDVAVEENLKALGYMD